MQRIAIQGQFGSFHHTVTDRWLDTYELVPCDTFHDVFEAVAAGTADQAVVAIENSLYGSITDVYDLLIKYKYPIVGELVEHIHLQLMAKSGVPLHDITEVYSHPVALNQCREWLEKHLPDAEIIEHHDTAGAVAYVKELDSPYSAAIAGTQASTVYDLPILESDIEDEKTNLTRFVVINPKQTQSVVDADKASLVITTTHHSGALYEALGIFAEDNVNLTKVQSRPIRGKSFEYQFFIDVDIDSSILDKVTHSLLRLGCRVTLLGHYKSYIRS
ncbi:MAG: prephenate dehydratase [Candidatus Saccharimonadales bacterium]